MDVSIPQGTTYMFKLHDLSYLSQATRHEYIRISSHHTRYPCPDTHLGITVSSQYTSRYPASSHKSYPCLEKADAVVSVSSIPDAVQLRYPHARGRHDQKVLTKDIHTISLPTSS